MSINIVVWDYITIYLYHIYSLTFYEINGFFFSTTNHNWQAIVFELFYSSTAAVEWSLLNLVQWLIGL